MAHQASKKCGPLLPDHHHIGPCTSNGIDSEQGRAPSPPLTISPRHQRKARKGCQAVFMPRIPFLCQYWRKQGRANFSVTRRENR